MSRIYRINGRELAARNQIAAAGWQTLATTPPLKLLLTPLTPADGALSHGLGAASRIDVEWGGAIFSLALPDAALTDWINQRLADLGHAAGLIATLNSEPWKQTARALAGNWLLQALSAAGRGQARLGESDANVESGASDGAEPPHLFAFSAEIGGSAAPTVLHGRLACDGLGLMLIAGLLQKPAAAGPLHGLSQQLPHRLRLTLGHTDLPLDRLRAVQRRDLVLITRPLFEGGDVFHLTLASAGGICGWRVRRSGSELTILDNRPSIMNDQDQQPADAPAISLAELPVRLSFDLGEVTLSLSEIEALQSGQTLTLDRPSGSAVHVRANGALIGSGELVDVDGRAAVSLLELFPPAPRKPATADDDDDDGRAGARPTSEQAPPDQQ